jgi:transposase
MELFHPRCAGLDVHKDTVVACVRLAVSQQVQHEVRTFGTTTSDLLALSDWLSENECTHVAMEATGVYWKPVWHILQSAEDAFVLLLANPQHIRGLPGRKTDVNDATWIADLLAHDLIRPSFVPPTEIQDVRALTRTRKQLVREKAQHTLRLQKTLEDTNIKLTGLISDLLGVSGRAILRALIAGETDPHRLLAVTTGRLKAKPEDLRKALQGQVRKIHRDLLKLHLTQIENLEKAISELEALISQALTSFSDAIERLTRIPGVSLLTAQTIVSEIGLDMTRFKTVGDLISWSGLCPGQNESAGKRRSTRVRKGAPWLKPVLVQAAWAAMHAKGTYLRAQFFRIQSRGGPKKAAVAVAASILTTVYYMLRDGAEYRELGGNYFDQLSPAKTATNLIRRLNQLGYQVDAHRVA